MIRRTVLLAVLALPAARISWSQGASPTLRRILTVPSDGTILGEIADVDVLPNGNVLVLDAQAKEILVFDRSGALVNVMGGEGQGPGEIRGATQIEVSRDGTIWVLDYGNARITRWTAEGTLLGSRLLDEVVGSPVGWPHELVVTDAGAFLKTSQFFPGEPMRVLRVREDLSGVVDSAAVIVPGPDASTSQFCPLTVAPDGRLLAARGDTVYAISVVGRHGKRLSELRRSGRPAVRRTAAELERMRAAAARFPRGSGGRWGRPDVLALPPAVRTVVDRCGRDGESVGGSDGA